MRAAAAADGERASGLRPSTVTRPLPPMLTASRSASSAASAMSPEPPSESASLAVRRPLAFSREPPAEGDAAEPDQVDADPDRLARLQVDVAPGRDLEGACAVRTSTTVSIRGSRSSSPVSSTPSTLPWRSSISKAPATDEPIEVGDAASLARHPAGAAHLAGGGERRQRQGGEAGGEEAAACVHGGRGSDRCLDPRSGRRRLPAPGDGLRDGVDALSLRRHGSSGAAPGPHGSRLRPAQASARKKRIGELPTERLTMAAKALGLA